MHTSIQHFPSLPSSSRLYLVKQGHNVRFPIQPGRGVRLVNSKGRVKEGSLGTITIILVRLCQILQPILSLILSYTPGEVSREGNYKGWDKTISSWDYISQFGNC